jgi:hypothetical protein
VNEVNVSKRTQNKTRMSEVSEANVTYRTNNVSDYEWNELRKWMSELSERSELTNVANQETKKRVAYLIRERSERSERVNVQTERVNTSERTNAEWVIYQFMPYTNWTNV